MSRNYTAKVLEKVSHGKTCWETIRVGIFDNDDQIGEYSRNYPSFAESTFFPFEQDGVWYALYSKDYTSTRVMRLPDCTDLGGEQCDDFGFCPTGYLVPKLCAWDKPADDDPRPLVANHDAEKWATIVGNTWFWPDSPNHPSPDEERKLAYLAAKQSSHEASNAWHKRNPFVERHAKWGLVMGCVWGDDSGNWKVEYLDLSRVSEGIIVRDNRFGYLELGPGVDLETGVRVTEGDYLNDPPEKVCLTVAVAATFRLDGKRMG